MIKGVPAKLYLEPNAQLRFYRTRTVFSKLDHSHAYQQGSWRMTQNVLSLAINIHKGLYQVNRLLFSPIDVPTYHGRCFTRYPRSMRLYRWYPSIWSNCWRTCEESRGSPGATRRERGAVKTRQVFFHAIIHWILILGFQILAAGLQPTASNVDAIQKAPAPTDVSQLKSFLGLINYYGKFLPNLSSVLSPLYRLLQKDSQWTWDNEQQQSFDHIKSLLT